MHVGTRDGCVCGMGCTVYNKRTVLLIWIIVICWNFVYFVLNIVFMLRNVLVEIRVCAWWYGSRMVIKLVLGLNIRCFGDWLILLLMIAWSCTVFRLARRAIRDGRL